jgi:NAD(P)-dependent dehydrogenase (short-subunit alcohol dehydrogenase family)
MNVPFKVNLQGQVALVTGGGGILCSTMAQALAACGAKIAVADLKQEAAEAVAAKIRADGGTAISVGCNVLEKASLDAANAKVKQELGPVDILINGAGGNHPKGTTTLEYLRKEDLAGTAKELITFYDLDPKGIEFVFNLNFLGTLLPTQAFTREMAGKGQGTIINISSMNAFRPLTKIPAYSGAKAAVSNLTQCRWFPHGPQQHHSFSHADEPVRHAGRPDRRAAVADLERSLRFRDGRGAAD